MPYQHGTSSGTFIGVLPVLIITWHHSELSLFTPASAPILPTQVIEQYESSVAGRPKTGVAASTSTNPSKPTSKTSPQHTHTAQTGTQSSTHSNGQSSGLSTGAKAGIDVGVPIAVIFLLTVGFWILRRRRKPKREESGRPYVDAKSELPDNSKAAATIAELPDRDREELASDLERQEVANNQRPQEVAGDRKPQELAANPRPQEFPAHREG